MAASSTHGPSTPSIHGSGFNRETICTVQNLCVDAERGEFHEGVVCAIRMLQWLRKELLFVQRIKNKKA
jgi:hypothetical protein